ncbi:MAG: hypothetical protein HFJ24_01935 [Clostridia bacterium]|nr:hypothetical protein [Clostridia bacterium]MCI9274810.1 hypothetical protein [Clostridia bacterium]
MYFGKITITLEEQVLYEVDILSENSIRKKTFGDYFGSLLSSFLSFPKEIETFS